MGLGFRTGEVISPYGEELVDLLVPSDAAAQLKEYAARLPYVQLSDRNVCDLELLATGAFSPLDRYLSRADYERVLEEMRLANGYVFPIPVTLPIESCHRIRLDHDIALVNAKNEPLAVMTVEDIYEWDPVDVAVKVLGTEDARHPFVAEMRGWGRFNLSGRLRVIELPRHYDFQDLRLSPAQTRGRLSELGFRNVVAFQTRNPMHRAHEEMTKRAAIDKEAVLLVHPAVGLTKPGDVDHYTRVRTYKILAERYYEQGRTVLSLIPLAMRLAGPREAVWHAIIRRNYGANYLIVGRDHASPGADSSGKPFYGPYDAQAMLKGFSEEIGVGMVPFDEFVYLPDGDRYEETSRVPAGHRAISLSGTQVREMYLNTGEKLPSWLTRPEVAEILAEAYPSRRRQGLCVWLTGLSGAGKSTTAEVLTVLLLELGRQVTVLDGDVVRTHLSKGLGFTREDRDANIRRIGFVAAEIVRHGGAVVCAAVSPYRVTRNEVRKMVGSDHFIEVFVDTPLEICERRDSKGMYARARRGEIKGFTGIDDPYEAPERPEIVIETQNCGAEENARRIISYLKEQHLVENG